MSWPPKDPEEILEYQNDWTKRLESETIVTSAWEVVSGTVILMTAPPNDPEINGAFTLCWLEGGTIGETCEITNTIVTSAGRTREATQKLKIKAK